MARNRFNTRSSRMRPPEAGQVRLSPSPGGMGRLGRQGGSREPQYASEMGQSWPQVLLTRRGFLYGAVGVGAAAAVGAGAAAFNAVRGNSNAIDSLDVPESSLITLPDLEVIDNFEDRVKVVNKYDLPYGTLAWCNDNSIVACLLPTESGSPLAQVGVLDLTSGKSTKLLEKAVGADDGFEIYDTRATSEGVIWTEANILENQWRVYTGTLRSDGLADQCLMEEGDATYDTPTLAVSDNRAFWQVIRKEASDDEPMSRLMSSGFGRNDSSTVFESSKRMATPPYGANDSVTIAARYDSASLYYQLLNLDNQTGQVRDSLILPHTVTPAEAGYGDTGFMFSFPDIYNLDGAIANLGTYVPRTDVRRGSYSAAPWFSFTRTPTAPPAWCNGLLIVKSSYSVCGIDLRAGTYFAIDVEDGAENYGEYLASSGSRDRFVTFTNIDHTPIDGKTIHACRVKVWTTA